MAEDHSPFEPPAAPLASDADGRSGWLAQSGRFVLKCFVLAIIFWSLWLFVVRPMMSSTPSSSSSSQSSQAQDKEQEALMKAYWEQIRQGNELQAEYKRQTAITVEHQKRMEAILTKQEELNRRFEAVIERWEKNAAPNR
jgi:flagellar biosynthesis/type III secretory pathway M-ring protein FliF/YscJ